MTGIELFKKISKEMENLHIPHEIRYNTLWSPTTILHSDTPIICIGLSTEDSLYYIMGITAENFVEWFTTNNNTHLITENTFHNNLATIINYYYKNIEKPLDF